MLQVENNLKGKEGVRHEQGRFKSGFGGVERIPQRVVYVSVTLEPWLAICGYLKMSMIAIENKLQAIRPRNFLLPKKK
ncbi:hypothetical protein MOB64_00340 [Bacillus haynesii]|nr:hypothetical protein [Bacillus haynesii]MCY7998434.1 hypothetical protein [Bacillus haynesii]